ncbi:MAG: ImmA/IrrE family metallo-endopeptidase [Verrucomicrobiaceae bacterium]|nr:MAG: ImmA/IrrE family metallo-endopeptidase [Verrucomicrobiaceae bacterium]
MNLPRPSGEKPARQTRRSKYPLSHPSIAALMTEALGDEGPEEVMRRKCRDLVAWARAKGWGGPPFDPEILAGLMGIAVEETDEILEGDGRIFPRCGRVVIQHRTGKPVERQRFTICHEIAHTCFNNVFDVVRWHNSAIEDDPAHRAFENLCDVGAAELLMPREEFSADLAASRLCLQHAEALRNRYIASLEATLRRLLELTPHPCAALFLTDESFGDFPAASGCMRVRWMWKSGTFKGFFRAGTMLPRGRCLVTDCDETCQPFPLKRETWWIQGKPLSWYVELVRLPVIPELLSYPKVVVLLHSRRPTLVS